MKIQNKKGITLVALAIVIIVMAMLSGLVAINANSMVKETNAREFAGEIKQLEYLVESYKTRNNGVIDFTAYYIDTTTIDEAFLNQLSGETIVDNTVTLYKLDYLKIDAMDTDYGMQENGENDLYLVSGETGTVYYLQGYEFNDTMHYKITEELKLLIGD